MKTMTKRNVKPDPIVMIVSAKALERYVTQAQFLGVEAGSIKLQTPVGDTYLVSGKGDHWDVELYDIKRERDV